MKPVRGLHGALFLLLSITTPSNSAAAEATGTNAAERSAGLSPGSVLVRARIMGTTAVNQASSIAIIDARYDQPSMVLPDGDVSYFLENGVAVSFQAGVVRTKPSLKDGSYMGFPLGDIPIGEIWSLAGVGTLQYHFDALQKARPYLGLGFSASVPLAIRPAGGFVEDFEVEPIAGLVLQAGLDYHLKGDWYPNLDFKQIILPTYSLKTNGMEVRVDMDTVTLGTGIGYRF